MEIDDLNNKIYDNKNIYQRVSSINKKNKVKEKIYLKQKQKNEYLILEFKKEVDDLSNKL